MTKEKLLKLLEPFEDEIRIFRHISEIDVHKAYMGSVSVDEMIYELKQDTKEPILILK